MADTTYALVQQLRRALLLTSIDAERNGFCYGSQSNCVKALADSAKWLRANKSEMDTHVAKPDPRDPDHTRSGVFVLNNCWRCRSGEVPCVNGNPNQCSYPVARND